MKLSAEEISDFCQKAILSRDCESWDDYSVALDRFGYAGRRFKDAVERRADGKLVDVYRYKNASIEISDYIAGVFDGQRLAGTMQWVSNMDLPKTGKILDLGADTGIMTAFLARFFPEAEIVAVERGAAGLDIAKERAEKLALKNIRFEQCDIYDFLPSSKGNEFTMVLSANVFHECLPIEDLSYDGFLFKEVNRILKKDGHFLWTDRIYDHNAYLPWAQIVEKAGFQLIDKDSTQIYFSVIDDEEEKIPAFHFKATKKSNDIVLNS